MRAFVCGVCGQLLFFENTLCLRCHSELGFAPERLDLVVTSELGPGRRRCANAELAACNWMLASGEQAQLCRSCRLTRTRPSDDDAAGLAGFAKAEAAKRRLLFELFDLGLPVDEERL